LIIDVPLDRLDAWVAAWAEGRAVQEIPPDDRILEALGFISSGKLTVKGEAYYTALWIRQDPVGTKEALGDLLEESVVVNTFRAHAGGPELPLSGAIRLIKRITQSSDERSAKRWLELMNRAGIAVYNRSSSVVRIIGRPNELLDREADAMRERKRGHLLSPKTPYGNLLALKELVRSARGAIRWYEQHLPPKVLEVLYKEMDPSVVSTVRLLSGPAHITPDTKTEFKRLKTEMAKSDVHADWRILTKGEAFQLHDRFFISDGISRNLPPLNTILAGSVGEILPSDVREADFDGWWTNAAAL
jgi:hypothetical protein